jgi:hypothetical protein
MQAALAAAQQAAVHYRTIADGGVDAQRVFLRSSQGGGGESEEARHHQPRPQQLIDPPHRAVAAPLPAPIGLGERSAELWSTSDSGGGGGVGGADYSGGGGAPWMQGGDAGGEVVGALQTLRPWDPARAGPRDGGFRAVGLSAREFKPAPRFGRRGTPVEQQQREAKDPYAGLTPLQREISMCAERKRGDRLAVLSQQRQQSELSAQVAAELEATPGPAPHRQSLEDRVLHGSAESQRWNRGQRAVLNHSGAPGGAGDGQPPSSRPASGLIMHGRRASLGSSSGGGVLEVLGDTFGAAGGGASFQPNATASSTTSEAVARYMASADVQSQVSSLRDQGGMLASQRAGHVAGPDQHTAASLRQRQMASSIF